MLKGRLSFAKAGLLHSGRHSFIGVSHDSLFAIDYCPPPESVRESYDESLRVLVYPDTVYAVAGSHHDGQIKTPPTLFG